MFCTTGAEFQFWAKSAILPQNANSPPFLLLAKRIPPMYWRLFQGVTLDSRMGYTGQRQFHGLGQAINWAKSSVGYSWSNKHFHKPVDLDLLLACTASQLPEHLVEDLKRRGN
ncbi:hypothetical protein HmCmsJML088_01886 [Escherichia coli]|nr:hypothetical protein HmCmsJML088_01886 [Escherichia coli]